MVLLKRFLQAQAAVWALLGLAVATAPKWMLVTVLDQPPYPDYTIVRSCGVMAISAALIAVLVSRQLDSVWWWSWAFAITDAALATLAVTNGLLGPVEGTGALTWLAWAAVSGLLAAGLLLGIGRAGEEKPIA